MSLLNGGLPQARKLAALSDREFCDQFVMLRRFDGAITDTEWQLLRAFPPARDTAQLVAYLAAIRSMPQYPLPHDHPLNPASRYTKAAA